MTEVIKLAVRPTLNLSVDGKLYRVDFPLSAVVLAEEKTGRSLKGPADWYGSPAKDLPALLAAGLTRHHPEITEAEVAAICDRLDPEAIGSVTEALGALAFPRWTRNYHANMEKLRKAGQAVTGGQPPKD